MKSMSFLIVLSLALPILGQSPPASTTTEMTQKEAREELARRYATKFADPIFDEKEIQRDLSVREGRTPGPTREIVAQGGGTVVLLIVVQKDGKVNDAIITKSASRSGDQAAIDAIKQWRFDTPIKDGQPVAVFLQVTMYLGDSNRR